MMKVTLASDQLEFNQWIKKLPTFQRSQCNWYRTFSKFHSILAEKGQARHLRPLRKGLYRAFLFNRITSCHSFLWDLWWSRKLKLHLEYDIKLKLSPGTYKVLSLYFCFVNIVTALDELGLCHRMDLLWGHTLYKPKVNWKVFVQ